MTLIDHYLKAVRLYLPKGAERDDIISELSEHLQAKLDDREERLGRPLTEVEQELLLAEHGDPAVVAERYGTVNRGLAFGRQLIGPALFPWYLRLLLMQFVLTIVVQFGVAPFTRIAVGITTFAIPMAVQFVMLTAVFSVIDLLQRRSNTTRAWSFPPAYLQQVPRWQSLSAIVLFTVIGLWWVMVPVAPWLILLTAADRLALTPVWRAVYLPILGVLLMGIVQRAATLARPEWSGLQAFGRLTTNGLLLIVLIPFLRGYPYVAPAAGLEGDARVQVLARTVSNAIWWNVFLGFGLYWLINLLFHAWFCVQHARYAARRNRERHLAVALIVVAAAAAATPARALAMQGNATATPAGGEIYTQRCASCHDTGVARAVPRATLNQMSADAIRAALVTGPMREQANGLSGTDIDRLVALLAVSRTAGSTVASAAANVCGPAPARDAVSGPHWSGWGVDATERRFQPASMARLTAADVPKLTLKWALGFPAASQAYAQPAVVGGRLFVGSASRKVYSVDARTGCQYWVFDAEFPVRTAISIGVDGAAWTAYFGDQHATLYAVDALNGTLRWKRRLDDHATAVITGAPTLSGNTLFVPVSSSEEGVGSDPKYKCCTFRGSVSAIDAATGTVKWKTYTIPTPSAPTSTNAQGTQRFGPSGAAVWDSPTVDLKLHRVYVTTGDGYSDPVADTTDSFLALDSDTGAIVWHRQMTAGDAYTMACGLPAPLDTACPAAKGPDFDFGSSPMLVELANGRRALIAGQKSGVVHALDPDRNGEILWQTRVGKGSSVGGVQWGAASDGARVYVALSDVGIGAAPPGVPGAQPTMLGIPLLLDPKAGGGLFALNPQTGDVMWTTPHPGCGAVPGCSPAQSAAVTAIPGVVFSGGIDGHLRAYETATGRIIWDADTKKEFLTVNGVAAHGGAIDGPGAVVVDGMLYVNSGYTFVGGAPGNVLLAFSVDGK